MKSAVKAPATIDEYISTVAPDVREILQKIRRTIRQAAPESEEVISYQMPAFKQGGILAYFAAWKKHIGFYPPVSGDDELQRAAAPYAGEKGNLQFPLDRPIPYDLIARIVRFRVKQNLAKAARRKRAR